MGVCVVVDATANREETQKQTVSEYVLYMSPIGQKATLKICPVRISGICFSETLDLFFLCYEIQTVLLDWQILDS